MNVTRRRLLTRIVQGFAVTGLGFLAWPFLKAFLPSFGRDISRDVRLDDLAPGEMKWVEWLGRRVLVVRRSSEVLAWYDDSAVSLKDPDSRASVQPAFATNPFRSMRPEIFVAFTNCTHLGCEVAPAATAEPGVAFECPCHQSLYDWSGRVLTGAAAPLNLEVPDYSYASDNVLKLESEARPG